MQLTSDLYKEILSNSNHYKETKLNIAGVEYGQESIVSVRTSGGLFTVPGIGNCAARQIDLEILPTVDIPRQAQIKAFVRLALGEQRSEWLPKGVFFISTRAKDKEAEFRIVRTKRFSVKPMSPEEAILQMNLLDHDFYVFRNSDDDSISIVYHRKKGGYGLIVTDDEE